MTELELKNRFKDWAVSVVLATNLRSDVLPLYKEADELLAITVSSIKTTRQKQEQAKNRKS